CIRRIESLPASGSTCVQLAVPLHVGGCPAGGLHVDRWFACRIAHGPLGEHDRYTGHGGAVLVPAIPERHHGCQELLAIVVAPPDDGFVIDRRAHADDLTDSEETVIYDVFDLACQFQDVDR